MLNNKEVINKLKKLEELLDKKSDLEYRIQYGELDDAKKRLNEIRRVRGDGPMVPSVYSIMPLFPIDKDIYLPNELKYEKLKKILILFAGGGIISILLYLITKASFLSSLGAVGIVGTAVLLYLCKGLKRIYLEKKKIYDESVEKFNQTMDSFRQNLSRFEKEKAQAKDSMAKFIQLQNSCHNDFVAAREEYQANINNAKQQLVGIEQQITGLDILSSEYHYLTKNILSSLQSGRADNLKDALNLAIEDDRKEREEEQRREEERLRQEAMEQQMEEMRRHNRQMEQQQQQMAKDAAEAEKESRRERERINGIRARSCACKCSNRGFACYSCPAYRPK